MAQRETNPPRAAIAIVRPFGATLRLAPFGRFAGGRTRAMTLPTNMAPANAKTSCTKRTFPPNTSSSVEPRDTYFCSVFGKTSATNRPELRATGVTIEKRIAGTNRRRQIGGTAGVPNPACRLEMNPLVGLEAKRRWGPPDQLRCRRQSRWGSIEVGS
jgi:hypothetical protein